jgi:hypothetical protein
MADIPIRWPNLATADIGSGSVAALTTFTLNGTTGAIQLNNVFRAEEACTITAVGFVQSTLTGTPGTLRVGIQTINTGGTMTGTWLASGNGYGDYSAWSSSDNGKYVMVTLGSSVTLARGDIAGLVLKPQAVGTWDASNNITVGYYVEQTNLIASPYVVTGTNTRPSVARLSNLFMRSSSRSYLFPYESFFEWEIDSDSTPSEVGAKFIIPAGVCDTFKINGIGLNFDANGASTFDLTLYEGTSRTVLQSISVDSDQFQTGGSANGLHIIYFDEATLSTLTAGTTYRVMVTATSTVSAGKLRSTVVPTANDATAYIGTEATFHYTEWNGSSYTDVTTRMPHITLLISDITEPSGGGGGLLVHPGMTGRVNG